jgi:hypothetical protein
VLAGCVSGYKEFYKQAQGATPEAVAARRAAAPPAMPIVERAEPGDSRAILHAYAKPRAVARRSTYAANRWARAVAALRMPRG